MTHLESLIAKAKAATPGPWAAIPGREIFGFTHILSTPSGALGHSPKESEDNAGYTRYKKDDAEFITACHPHLILALCELAMAAERVIEAATLEEVNGAHDRLEAKLAAVRGVGGI